MKRKLFGLIGIVMSSMLIYSCSKDAEDKLAPSCNTENMKYSANILPIISANCYSCHTGSVINGGIDLEGYTKLKMQVDNGNLVGVITHAAGFEPMPYNLPKLSDCDINKIKAWIQSGALNN